MNKGLTLVILGLLAMVQALKAQSCNGQYNECSTDESNQAFTKKYRGLPLMPEAEAASMIERKGKKITLKKHITAQIIPWGDEGIGGIGTWTITRNDKEVDEGYRICSCDGTQEKSLSTGSVPNGEVKPITTFFYQFKNDQIRNLNNKALTFDVLFTDDCSTGRCRQSGRMRCTSGKNDPCFRV